MSTPYTVEINGVPVHCESAQAALDLIRLHGGSDSKDGHRRTQPATTQTNSNGTRWTDARIAEFFKQIKGKPQRKLIDALLEHDDRTDEQLLQLLGLSNGSGLGGVFAGLWKNAKKVGGDPRELYVKKPINLGDTKAFAYSLHEAFRTAAERHTRSK